MKKRLQLFVSLSTLVILATGMFAFVAVAEKHIDSRLSDQIAADNAVVAETVATMVGGLVAAGDRELLLASLHNVCMSVTLPNAGFICIVDGEGTIVAGPSPGAASSLDLGSLAIIPKGSDVAHAPDELPRNGSIVGKGVYGSDERVDIVAATPIPGTELTVLIHQDHRDVRTRSRDSARSLAIPALIITMLLAIVAYFVVDGIVAGYTGKLEIVNRGLSESSRKRSQLIHILCHDLKNPVGAIRTATQLLRRGGSHSGGSDHSAMDDSAAVDLIETSAKSALEMIENVRQSEALASGKRSIQLAPVDLQSCARTSVAMLRRDFAAKEVSAEVTVPDSFHAMAEETSLCNSVLNNLLSNAIKFSDRGSRVVIDADRTEGWIRLSVRDFGIGMPPDILSRVFEPTAQTSRPGTEGESGTGFGMPLVKQFVESYGGSVSIESRVNDNGGADHGTEVTILLRPATEASSPDEHGETAEEAR